MRELLLIGAGGHCRAVIDVLERTERWRIGGIIEGPEGGAQEVLGYPVIGTDDELPDLRRHFDHALITVGQIKSAAPRQRLFLRLKALGYVLPVVVSPLAWVSPHSRLGEGCAILHFACVGPRAVVGDNSIINTRALLEHDAVVGTHCHISTGAILNGGCQVGDGCFVGSGSALREAIRLGDGVVVGMGLSVRRDLPNGTLYTG